MAVGRFVAAPHYASAAGAKTPINCGSDRWDVKTLSDKLVKNVTKKPVNATVNALQARARPGWNPPPWAKDKPRQWDFLGPKEKVKPELSVERTVWHLTEARLISGKLEDDLDIHLIVEDPVRPHKLMTVEFPDVDCKGAAASTFKKKMADARRELIKYCGPFPKAYKKLKGSANIDGVGFFDRPHGQKGDIEEVKDPDPHAKTAKQLTIELHPALLFDGPRKRSDCQ